MTLREPECNHCGRTIPEEQIVNQDCSACPLAYPCIQPNFQFVDPWPMAEEDDDDDVEHNPVPIKPLKDIA